MEILKYVDQLEEIVDTATKVPFSNKVMVNVDEVFEVIDLIREHLPQELKDAQSALLEKDRILNEATAKAERELDNARKEATAMISENEIVRHAQIEAEAVMERANQVALEVREGARSYANDVLYQIENSLDKALYTVKKSRDEIRLNTNKKSATTSRKKDVE
ncbi:MAG: ATPase [Firmicutes bacterium]|nr:ATPase [Bacillota bacterium]